MRNVFYILLKERRILSFCLNTVSFASWPHTLHILLLCEIQNNAPWSPVRRARLINTSEKLPYVQELYMYIHSWIRRDQLDVTCFIISLFSAQHVSDVNTSILGSFRLIRWVISWLVLLWFDVCWCYVVVWLGWCGIRMQAEALLQPAYGYHTTPPQPNHNVTPTHIEPE